MRMISSFVTLLALVALMVAATQAPDAVLRIAFAHACATANHADMELVDRKDDHAGDAQALTRDFEVLPEASAESRGTDGNATAHRANTSTALSFAEIPETSVRAAAFDVTAYRAEPPSRARARLMVFLI